MTGQKLGEDDEAARSPLLRGLGGPGRGNRPARVYPSILVLGLLL